MKGKAVLLERSRVGGWIAAAGGAVFALAALAELLAPTLAPDLVVVVLAFGWPFLVAVALAWLSFRSARRTAVQLAATDGVLTIDGVVVQPAARFVRGDATVLDNGCVRVGLRVRRGLPMLLELESPEAARALLAGLGLDRRSGTTQFRVRLLREYAGLLWIVALLANTFALVVSVMSPPLGLAILAFTLGLPILDSVRTRLEVTVGSDGLHLRSPFGHTFVSHAQITSIERIWPGSHTGPRRDRDELSYGFEIETDDGQCHRIDTRAERNRAEGTSADPVHDAAHAAWTAWKRTGVGTISADAATLLARGKRTSRAWATDLRALAVDGGAGYRVAPIDGDLLYAMLVDATAPRELRVAAAVVLGAQTEHAARLRVAADDVADPVVRRIAVAVSEDDEARLESELEEALAMRDDADRMTR